MKMCSRIVSVAKVCNQHGKLWLSSSFKSCTQIYNDALIIKSQTQVLPFSPCLNIWRSSHSFFSRLTAEQLWKGVTTVSNAGRKKGRGKGSSRRMAKDLNRGQVIGFGKVNMLWPGLNAPIVQGRELIRQKELPPDPDREKKILELRSKTVGRRTLKLSPLERGWCSNKLPGRSLGPPDPIGDETFEGFDSRVLEFQGLSHMTSRGRTRNFSAMVVVGNKKGLLGFDFAKSPNGPAAAKTAKNRAAKVLRYVQIHEGSVIHDFFYQYGAVRVFVEKRPPGYGLDCHRVIKAICEVVGIKHLFATVEGPTDNYKNLTRAFVIGLMKQKTFKQLAEEKGLHVVKRLKSQDYFPIVVASPEKCRTESEIEHTEIIDFKLHLHNNKVVEPQKEYKPFYINFPSYIKEMKDREKLRNHRDVRIHLIAKYDALKSFVQIQEEERAKQKEKETVEGE